MKTYVVHLRQYSEKGRRRPLGRFTLGPGDLVVRVEACRYEEAHERALGGRTDWYVVMCATDDRLADKDFARELLARAKRGRVLAAEGS